MPTRYEENRDILKQKALEYYYKKREERLEYGKQYGLANRGQIRDYYKEWYDENRDKCLATRRAAYHAKKSNTPKPPRPSKPEKPAKPTKQPKPPKPEKPAKPPKPIKPQKPAKYVYIPPEPVQRYADASFELSFG